jgi:hypothetical protein
MISSLNRFMLSYARLMQRCYRRVCFGCLFTSTQAALVKLKEAARFHRLSLDLSRVVCVAGDLTKRDFGLQHFAQLADKVLHSSWTWLSSEVVLNVMSHPSSRFNISVVVVVVRLFEHGPVPEPV